MPLSDKDREKLAFDSEWQNKVQLGAELKRWKPDILGPAIEDYREAPAGKEIDNTLKIISNFLEVEASKYDLTEGDFWMEVKKHSGKEQKTAKRADEINFYDRVESDAEVARKDKKMRISRVGKKVKYPIEKVFRKTLKTLGFIRTIKGKYKGEKTKILGKNIKPEEFNKLREEIISLTQELAGIDSKLAGYADEISQSKAQLSTVNLTEDQESQIRADIVSIQSAIRSQTTGRTSKTEKINTKAARHNLLMDLIKDELEQEGKYIISKWGNKVTQTIRKKVVLVEQLDKLTKGGNDQQIAKISAQIRALDLELNDLRKSIFAYKAKYPIFLYERFVGVQSIPVLKPIGQASTILSGMEMPEVNRPPSKTK